MVSFKIYISLMLNRIETINIKNFNFTKTKLIIIFIDLKALVFKKILKKKN